MKEIKKIDLMSFARITTLFGMLMGLFTSILYNLMRYSGDLPINVPEFLSSLWSILFLPLIYGLMYFLGGIIFVSLYNLFSKRVGGIKIQI